MANQLTTIGCNTMTVRGLTTIVAQDISAMKKIQTFENTRHASNLEALSTYHPDEDVWTSDYCEPHEWNTEEEMRYDMYIAHVSEGDNRLRRDLNSYTSDIDTAESFLTI